MVVIAPDISDLKMCLKAYHSYVCALQVPKLIQELVLAKGMVDEST